MFSQKEKIVETKSCRLCSASFDITDRDVEFYEKVSPVFKTPPTLLLSGEEQKLPPNKSLSSTGLGRDGGGYKYLIPTPTLCPHCRQQRRLSWRNESKLYKRTCSLTGNDIISIYSPDKPLVIYNQHDWWDKKFNPLDYGRDFDFSKPFFEQFYEFQKIVPRIAVLNGLSENTDYANHSYHNKNSYMVYSSGYLEDSLYCINTGRGHHCVDCYRVFDSSYCYDCLDCENCTQCRGLERSKTCFQCYFCIDCENCRNCIGCKNLKNHEYSIFNKKVTKEEFDTFFKDLQTSKNTREEFQKMYQKVCSDFPSKNLTLTQCEQIKDSNNCSHCENISYCFDCHHSRNIKYTTEMLLDGANDSYDYDIWGENASFIYEVHCTGNAHQIMFSNVVWGGRNVFYSDNCLNDVRDCFGCIGLHDNEQYCVFNKRYTKEEYEILVPRIIEHMMKTGEWGEFFPSNMSPFGYNETHAQEYFPLTREEALRKGFNWSDYEAPFPKVEKSIPAEKLPDDIAKIPDDILNWAIECEITKKPFRIIKQELEFYRKMNIPLPRKSPEQRCRERFLKREPRKLFQRNCDKCGKEIQTTYAPERPEIVYCESCYNKEVY